MSDKQFLWPIDKPYRWISGYSYNPPSHAAEDFGTPNGANYYAMQDGVVTGARFIYQQDQMNCSLGYGNYLQIDHGDGWVSLCAHLLEGYVSLGDTVKVGQLVAKTNNNGCSSGPHAHISLKKYGSPVKPSSYFVDSVGEIEPDPPPVPDPEIIAPTAIVSVTQGEVLLVRSYPKVTSTARILDRLPRGTEVPVVKVIPDGFDKWLQIGYKHYCCMVYHDRDGKRYDLCRWKVDA